MFFFHKQGARAFFGRARFGQAHSSRVMPPVRRIRPSLFDFRGAFFLRKKARSPIQKGFGGYFSAVLQFTGQQ